MNCWSILGIAPDSDKKAIKLAYAKLLKKTRPDDDPDGFKTLHAAYKTALAYSAQPRYEYVDDDVDEETLLWEASAAGEKTGATFQSEIIPEPEQPVIAERGQPLVEEKVLAQQQVGSDFSESEDNHREDEGEPEDWYDDAYFEALYSDWDSVNDKAQALVRSPLQVNKVSEWRFIESVPSMVDLEFRTRISDHLFGIISETNQIALQNKSLYIKTPVLDYLNNFFQWDQNWSHLSDEHGDGLLEGVFPYLSAEAGRNKNFTGQMQTEGLGELFYYGRIGAFTLDLLVGLPLALLIGSLEFEAGNFLIAGAFYLLLVVPILEASKWQASLGKRLMGLVVVNKQGLRIPWYQSFWRALVTMGCLAGFKIVVWINLYLSWKNSILLQDYVSRSYVVKFRK